jgi:NtrC-family two-component system response regulator AlgB
VPPLRERPEDIAVLAEHFLKFFSNRQGRAGLRFSSDAIVAMARHAWPGNLRELRNAIERAVILSSATVFEALDLGLVPSDVKSVQLGSIVSLKDLEREHIARVIAEVPTLEGAARVLGIDVTTLSRKRKRYGLV